MYVYGGLSVSSTGTVRPKVPPYVFVTCPLVGNPQSKAFLNCAASYMSVRVFGNGCLSVARPRAHYYYCEVRYALRIFTEGFQRCIPSKQQRSPLPNGNVNPGSNLTNQVQHPGGHHIESRL